MKKSAVRALLVALTLWPAVHIWLVKSYGVSAWKLAGWGMYSVPRPKFVGMEVYYREQGGTTDVRLHNPEAKVAAVANDFLERYRWLGRLAFPDTFMEAMLELNPSWERVRVTVYQPVMDRETAMMIMREHVFERGASAADRGR
jgi:hypothetical protein